MWNAKDTGTYGVHSDDGETIAQLIAFPTVRAAFTTPTVRARFIAPVCQHMYLVTHGRRKRGPYIDDVGTVTSS
jgi:hypothetical protein